MQPWREASSLVIVTRAPIRGAVASSHSIIKSMIVSSSTPETTNETSAAAATTTTTSFKSATDCDYRIMMVKRSGLSSFLASAYVFPGGRVELADFSARWWEVFNRFQLKNEDLSVFSHSVKGPRPPIVSDSRTIAENTVSQTSNLLPADIGLRISALRETFEETGVLLLTRPGDSADSYQPLSDRDNVNVDLSEWRDKVRKDANMFIDLCLETNLCPNLWSLYEWWNWLTPTSVGHKRCDTMFYVCFLEVEPKVVLDNEEVTTLKWCTPNGMLDEHSTADVFLAPPQVYELSRLCNFTEFDALKQFSIERQPLGIERWLPVISTYQDGAIALLPGDEFYPSEPDLMGRKPVPDHPETLAEVGNRAKSINRLEIRGPVCHARANVELPCGHLQPISHAELKQAVLSPMA
ncbi:Nucleoside diphosphate-linked moiety X motif 19 [Fragariocoptes setiger]|uniref:Nucleoside diphosphate-linked moiety X motif 19 n=1 Tax=Fragariocoptes setiger TaxID=1670756 RepID=A0ABQ7S747_9ACAR|nr:Nucleoside diphosphate-linked moiety X motif 19 [Fragariocoptes setiger]